MSALLTALTMTAQGQALPRPALAPVETPIRALVLRAQPRATFGSAPDLFYGQYRTENHVFQTRAGVRLRQPPVVELGPLPRGFYLQLEVTPGTVAGTQTTPPGPTHPWTTVTSTYPLTPAGRMIVMTWEATPGSPRGLAGRIRSVLLRYVGSLK